MRILTTNSQSKIGRDFCKFFNNFYGLIGIDNKLDSSMKTLMEDEYLELFKNKLDVVVFLFDCNILNYVEIELLKEFMNKINCKKVMFVNYVEKNQDVIPDKITELIESIDCDNTKIMFGSVDEDYDKKIAKLFQSFEDFMAGAIEV